MSDLLQKALEIASYGRSVIPSGAPGKDGKLKRPMLDTWTEFQTTRPAPEQIRRWFYEKRPSLFGIVTGPVSGMFTIDPDDHDPDDPHPETLELMLNAGLKPHRRTKRGHHFDFKYPDFDLKTKAEILPHIDIRADGGFINVIGSNADAEYEILIPNDDAHLYSFDMLPDKIKAADIYKPAPQQPQNISVNVVTAEIPANLADRILAKYIDDARDHTRNETGIQLACQLRDNRFSIIDAEPLMRQYARAVTGKGTTPYYETEAIASLQQAFKRPAREPWTAPTTRTAERINTDTGAAAPDNNLPEVKIGNRELRDVTAESIATLIKANSPEPSVFKFGPGLVRIGHDEKKRPFTETIDTEILRYKLTHAANYVRCDEKGNKHSTFPPVDLCKNILVARPEWDFPPISGIVEVPTLRPDFSLLDRPGYDRATGLYYIPAPALEIPAVPDKPTDSQLQDAVNLISEPYADFLFTDGASRANTIAALLLTCLRDAISGPVPLTLISKPQPGCGGSLAVDVNAIVATGREAHSVQAPRDPEEWRKLLTTLLIAGHRYICFDNVDRMLESEALASFITATYWQDRALGMNTIVTLPNKTVCFANGNNTHVGGNLARRIIPVKLDSPGARPFMRDTQQFKHDNLREWVTANRGAIITAILTVVRAWANAGRPKNPNAITLGSFESYSSIMCSLLAFMGMTEYLGNLEELYTEMDIDTPAWAEFFRVWHETITTPVTVKELISHFDNAELKNALPEIVADIDDKGYTRKLGNQLAKREKQKFENGFMLRRAGEFRKALRWESVCLKNETHTNLRSNVCFESLLLTQREEKDKCDKEIYTPGGNKTLKTHNYSQKSVSLPDETHTDAEKQADAGDDAGLPPKIPPESSDAVFTSEIHCNKCRGNTWWIDQYGMAMCNTCHPFQDGNGNA